MVMLLLIRFLNVAGINLTYIVKKDEHVTSHSCVAEELERYSAIGWIYPIPENKQDLPNISKFRFLLNILIYVD